MEKKQYKCLFNHELLILATSQTKYQSYDDDIQKEQVVGYVKELENTDVDVIMCCPTAWRRNLWYSEVDRHWQDEASSIKEPLPDHDWKYHEKAYYRMRRYMLTGADPVGDTLKTARETGKDFFISYRMNDHHYLRATDAHIHPTFLKNNPQLLINDPKIEVAGQSGFFDYMKKEVRDYYFSLFHELTELYDIDGIELDFLRAPVYFATDDVEKGIPVMTAFVQRIRDMLDEYSKKRNKRLQLCIRVPHIYSRCLEIGLDVENWDKSNIIDMVNVSSHFIMSLSPEIEEYKKHIKNSRVYGEMHFVVRLATMPSGFSNNVSRKTTKEIYRANAHNYLVRGCDGVSLFNFNYTRDHHFNEPRREGLFGCEPPFEVLCGITDIKHLAKCAKHYFIDPYYCSLPQKNEADVKIFVADDCSSGQFKKAIMRFETTEGCTGFPIDAFLNGTLLKEIQWGGELFPPLSIEGVPPLKSIRFFEVPVELLQKGDNTFKVINKKNTKHNKDLTFRSIELALYTHEPF